MEFPKASIQERDRSREHENERKLYAFLKKFFKDITVYVTTTSQYLLFGKTNSIGTDPVQVQGSIQVSTNSNSNVPFINLVRSKGTASAPSAIANGDTVGYVAGTGYDGSNYAAGATVEVVASENWNSTSHGTALVFKTTDNGTTVLAEAGKIQPTGDWVAGGDYFYVPSGAGAPVGAPPSIAGHIAMRIDETGNKAYIYSGGSWVALN